MVSYQREKKWGVYTHVYINKRKAGIGLFPAGECDEINNDEWV